VEVDEVGVSAECLDGVRTRDFVVGVGSELLVGSDARVERELVSTGDLSPVDFGEFEVLSQQNYYTKLRAPSAPGQYEWRTLSGEAIEVTVFSAGSSGLELLSPKDGRLQLRSVPGAAEICTEAPPAIAELQVTSGNCTLGLGGVRAEGVLPVALSVAGSELAVHGSGPCEVAANFEDKRATLTLEAREPARAPQGPGSALGLTAVEFGGPRALPSGRCEPGVTNGKCELLIFPIPDADCITDADWRIETYDALGPITKSDYVGTGLTLSLSLGVVVGPSAIEGKRAPLDVSWDYDERLLGLLASKDDVDVQIGGCMAPTGQTRIAQLKFGAVGPHQIELSASNLNDVAELDFAARAVDRCLISLSVDAEQVDGPEVQVFTGSQVGLGARYARSDGLALRGDAPLRITAGADGTGTTITETGALSLGVKPAVYQVTPTRGSGAKLITAVGAQNVVGLQATPFEAHAEDAALRCTRVRAHDASGREMYGAGNVPLRVSLDGGGVWALDASSGERQVCMRKLGDGSPGVLTLRLGSAALVLELPSR
jgi:hypothetical protein